MTQKTTILFIDDIDGGTAEGTVRFGLDGTEYEIDLNAEHTEELRGALTRFVTHARKVTVGRNVRGRSRITPSAAARPDTAVIRAWAAEHGYAINDRGRVPGNIVADFEADQGKAAVPQSAPAAAPAVVPVTEDAGETPARKRGKPKASAPIAPVEFKAGAPVAS